jgi:ABC-type multidrug transport system permease subunit
MRSYVAYIRNTLRLTLRDRMVLFFNYFFPLIFFIAFGEGFEAGKSSGAAAQVFTMVLLLGVLGSGLFGGGLRAVAEREANILRRFKVAPITPAPILVSSIVTALLTFFPSVVLFLALGKWRWQMPLPANLVSLAVMLGLGLVAFRAMGLIVASVVNSMAESQLVIQLLYMPMLLLSGATVPLTILPDWLQIVAQFLPATHLHLGLQGILVRGESLAQNLTSLGALALSSVVSCFISLKLFRWEKEEKLKGKAKLWVVAALAPFLVLGGWHSYTRDNLDKSKILARAMRRTGHTLFRNARIVTGEGRVIENGALLVRDSQIAELFEGAAPDPKTFNAEAVEASGKTILPGLIDLSVNLVSSGGHPPLSADPVSASARSLAAYLFSGVAAVRQDPPPPMPALLDKARADVDSGRKLGAELLTASGSMPAPPALAALEAEKLLAESRPGLFSRSLAQQASPPALLATSRDWATSAASAALRERLAAQPGLLLAAMETLAAAAAAGHLPPFGTRSGALLVPHGPAAHRELQLWVAAGVQPADAIRAATSGAARLLGVADRIGSLEPGHEATLLIVEGNPLEDITVTERIFEVMFKGERVWREGLFNSYDKKK